LKYDGDWRTSRSEFRRPVRFEANRPSRSGTRETLSPPGLGGERVMLRAGREEPAELAPAFP